MRELYDPVRTAALFKEAREVIAALDSEIRDLAVQIRSAALGDIKNGGDQELATGPHAIALTTSKPELRNKPFWKFWR
jgi:hypothetical protein